MHACVQGRKQWGRQVIEVRNLARILETLVPGHPLMANIVNLSIAHCHAMRHQLRQVTNVYTLETPPLCLVPKRHRSWKTNHLK